MLLRSSLLQLCLVLTLSSFVFGEDENLHTVWGELLTAHVVDGRVDYQGFKNNEIRLDGYLETLNATDPASLTEAERLAFYINAYNAYTVKLILENYEDGKPVRSIKSIGGLFQSPWSIQFARVGGEELTLDNIEHDIIRPGFNEPRVHFAVNCASVSCPPLLNEPYTGSELESQLELNTIRFLNDKNFNYISGNTLYVSKIFKWFGEDFNNEISGFVGRYARGELLAGIQAAGESLKVKYLDYDWSLNSQ